MLLCEKFINAHLDTSFASIDPKIMKLHPIEGTYPGNCAKSHLSQTCLPCMVVMTVDICLNMFMFLLLFTTIRDQDVKNQYQLSQ